MTVVDPDISDSSGTLGGGGSLPDASPLPATCSPRTPAEKGRLQDHGVCKTPPWESNMLTTTGVF